MNIYADTHNGTSPTVTDVDRLYIVNDKNETVLKIIIAPDGLSFDVAGIHPCFNWKTGQRAGPMLDIRPIATNLVRISLGANE